MHQSRFPKLALTLGCICLVLVGHWAMLRTPLVSDEPTHLDQIIRLHSGDGSRHPHLTTFETFHWVAARGLDLLGGSESGNAARLVSSLIAMLAVLAAFLAARAVHRDDRIAMLRSASIILMPLLLPFVFLIYTDALALAAILFGVWEGERRRWFLAGMFGVFAVAVRQMNIIWLAWLFATWVIREAPWVDLRIHRYRRIAEALPFAVGALAFLVFVWLNGGVAIGDPLSHPVGIYDENLFFLLLIAFVLQLPVQVARIPDAWRMASRRPVLSALVAAGLMLWFIVSFRADHWYNVLPHHVHNEVAMWLNDVGSRVVVAPLLVLSLFSLIESFGRRAEAALWIGATALVLVPSYMIEPRYAIVPLALWTVLRPKLPAWQEAALFTWTAMLGVAAFRLTANGSFTI